MIIYIKESWKWIPGFVGKYKVSTRGRVKSVPRFIKTICPHKKMNVKCRCNEGKMLKGRVLKPGLEGPDRNTPFVFLGAGKIYKISRLVAITFISNPNGFREINHIDGNPRNNFVSNLEWCDRKTNENHAYTLGLKKRDKLGRFANVKNGKRHVSRGGVLL